MWRSLQVYYYRGRKLNINVLSSPFPSGGEALKKVSVSLIFFIFLVSRSEPEFLAMLYTILFCFLIYFSSFFHLCSEFLYYLTASALFPSAPPSPSLMYFWSERLSKTKSELCDVYFCSGIHAFLQSAQQH